MVHYEDILIISIIGLTFWITILYFIIKGASRADEQVRLQKMQINLLKLIAKKLNATDDEIKEIFLN